MLGLIQERPLLLTSLLDHAATYHGAVEIVSRMADGGTHRYGYRDAHRRARQLANALVGLGVRPSDRVATLAWNTHRHLEIQYAAAGVGAVCHPVNPKLTKEQIAFIINDAEDGCLFLDTSFAAVVADIRDRIPSVRQVVVLGDEAETAACGIPGARSYESLLAGMDDRFAWVEADERNAVTLCYTSGTTGNPKGVLSSHRACVLHAFLARSSDLFDLSPGDSAMAVVPMYHANMSWGMPYAAAMAGAKLVLPGSRVDGAALHRLIGEERVTRANGVPTIWLGMLSHLEQCGGTLPSLERIIIAGAAPAPSMIQTLEERHGVTVCHGWGMTETGPFGTAGSMPGAVASQPPDQQRRHRVKQGHGMYGVEMKIVDDKGVEQPRDGKSSGQLLVRGPWVLSGYFKGTGEASFTPDGWFVTGDVATIDEIGFLQLIDRSKDLVKSGGEWISSIELENLAVGHPAVAEAAVIGVPHPTWGERPLLVVVRKPGALVEAAELRDFLAGHVAKWCVPDDVAFVAELPHSATGKIQKAELRRWHQTGTLITALAETR